MTAVFLFTAMFRFLALKNGFPNDHFLHLAGARQMLFGEWPTRDFQDPGLPLMYAASAAAQALLGDTLFSEAVLVALAFAAAAVLTGAAVVELTRVRTLALLAAVLEVAVFPRTYGYPKVLLYAAGFLVIQRYVSQPGLARLVITAVAATIAFFFRHDHGIYLAIGGAIAVALAPGPGGWRGSMGRVARFLSITAALLAPYLLYVHLNGGLRLYLRTGLEFSAREAGRQWHVWPSLSGEQMLPAALLYACYGIPVMALLWLAINRRQPDARTLAARVVPVAIVALLVDVSFIRDPLNTRLADAIVPAVVLGAWLASRAWLPGKIRWLTVPVSVLLIALFARSVAAVGHTMEELDRSGLLASWTRVPGYFTELTAALRAPLAPTQIPSAAAGHLLPFLSYAGRCTTPDQRLLVMGFLPEVPVLAHRAFAGGQSTFVPGYYRSDENQRLVLRRLRTEVVPFALVPKDYAADLDETFPLLTDYLRARYVPLVTLGAESETGVQVLVDGMLRPSGQDAETGWPCFSNVGPGVTAARGARRPRNRPRPKDQRDSAGSFPGEHRPPGTAG
jgi:hypothetical protein